jgi:hypothetical protein
MRAKFAFKIKVGDIIRIPMYDPCLFIVTNDNTNLGGYGPGSIELRSFPDMDRDIFYRLPCHIYEIGAKKVT